MQIGAAIAPLSAAPTWRSTSGMAAPGASDRYIPSSADQEVPANLKKVLEAAGKPYYDEAKDVADIAAYYAEISPEAAPAQFYEDLSAQVKRTHRERFGFDPIKRLFPWVDLRPNLRLQSIYASQPVSTDDPVKATKGRDFVQKVKFPAQPRVRKDGSLGPARNVQRKVDFREQSKQWAQQLLQAPNNALEIAQRIALVEGYRFYNAEHSVPQFFFDHDKVPKGDLHHLFTCEKTANEQRGCRPYNDTRHDPQDRSQGGWAPKEINEFEPDNGKGPVARAALYFLLRYPGEIGDKPLEYTKKSLDTLLRWNREDPVSLYEKHRNQAIAEVQGNRNPFIDHPEWAEKIDFTAAFGEYGQSR
ncbi:endonuclease [bacterium]|nr:endonuclease [bacterium]